MAQRESILSPLSNSIYIKIRQDFLELSGGDHCMAALLSYYEYKLNAIISNMEEMKLKNKSYTPSADDYFIECSPSFLSKALLGLFGRTKIIEANERLHEQNFITIKTEKIGNQYKTTKVALNIEPMKKSLLTLFENGQPLIQKQTTPYSDLNNPLSENGQPPYSEMDRINNTTNKSKIKLNKKEQFLLDFDSELINIFNERPYIEESVLEWIEYKFNKGKGYSTLRWLTSILKNSDYQINQAIGISLSKEYEGLFPDSIKDMSSAQPERKLLRLPTEYENYMGMELGLLLSRIKTQKGIEYIPDITKAQYDSLPRDSFNMYESLIKSGNCKIIEE